MTSYDIDKLIPQARQAVLDGRPYRVAFIDRDGDMQVHWLRQAKDAYVIASRLGWEVESILYYGNYKIQRKVL